MGRGQCGETVHAHTNVIDTLGGRGVRGGPKHSKGLLVDSVVYNAATPHLALLYSQDRLYNLLFT